jgi:hypothetical protein
MCYSQPAERRNNMVGAAGRICPRPLPKIATCGDYGTITGLSFVIVQFAVSVSVARRDAL